jgi:hypothetical protein
MRRTDTDELKIELEYNGRKVETTSRKLRELAELAKTDPAKFRRLLKTKKTREEEP